MKAVRRVRGVRHEERLAPRREDPYHDTMKDAAPATCPRCRAGYQDGRWTWSPAPPDAARRTCPACQRLEDDFPAGYVTLKGSFFDAHRREILDLVMARAERARLEHPLQRIIGMQDTSGGLVVTTTDARLARGLAIALQAAFKGNLNLSFSRDENFIRATWSR